MKANLISDALAFIWTDLTIDRAAELEDLRLAILAATEHGDQIYSSPELIYMEALYSLAFMPYAELLLACPWLTRDHQILIARIINGKMTPNRSGTLADLHTEFAGSNNSWFGLLPKDVPRYVHDKKSWQNLHKENVWEYYRTIDKNSAYFKMFYVARLQVAAGSLKQSIRRGLEHPIFDRLDTPTVISTDVTLHGEQIQMHFNDKGKSALNLNGVWKHGGFNIPRDAKEKLIEWGFIIQL